VSFDQLRTVPAGVPHRIERTDRRRANRRLAASSPGTSLNRCAVLLVPLLSILWGGAVAGPGTPSGEWPSWEDLCRRLEDELPAPIDADPVPDHLPYRPRCFVSDRRPVTPTAEIVLASKGGVYGLFVLRYDPSETVLTLGAGPTEPWPKIESATSDSVTLEFFDDYGFSFGKRKHFFDLSRGLVQERIDFRRLHLDRAQPHGERVFFAGRMGSTGAGHGDQGVIVLYSPAGGAAVEIVTEIAGEALRPVIDIHREEGDLVFPADRERYVLGDGVWRRESLPTPVRRPILPGAAVPQGLTEGPGAFSDFRFHAPLPDVQRHLVETTASDGESVEAIVSTSQVRIVVQRGHRLEPEGSGILVGKSGQQTFHPLPFPSPELYRELRPEMFERNPIFESYPPILNARIGPFQIAGGGIVFGLDFYDGEGLSGLGGYGVFDLDSLEYDIRYHPELVEWSSSALLVDGGTLWLGLRRNPEGAWWSAGLAEIDMATGSVRRYPETNLIHRIIRWEDKLLLATGNGISVIEDGKLRSGVFDVDREGNYFLTHRTPVFGSALYVPPYEWSSRLVWLEPNPIRVCRGRPARTTVHWRTPHPMFQPRREGLQIRVGSPEGKLFAEFMKPGSRETGPWVRNGMRFYLVGDQSGSSYDRVTAAVEEIECD
jgi:hypothetical protein